MFRRRNSRAYDPVIVSVPGARTSGGMQQSSSDYNIHGTCLEAGWC